jgi:hypothetical protein
MLKFMRMGKPRALQMTKLLSLRRPSKLLKLLVDQTPPSMMLLPLPRPPLHKH